MLLFRIPSPLPSSLRFSWVSNSLSLQIYFIGILVNAALMGSLTERWEVKHTHTHTLTHSFAADLSPSSLSSDPTSVTPSLLPPHTHIGRRLDWYLSHSPYPLSSCPPSTLRPPHCFWVSVSDWRRTKERAGVCGRRLAPLRIYIWMSTPIS